MKIVYFLLLFLFIDKLSYSQNIDSLYNEARKSRNSKDSLAIYKQICTVLANEVSNSEKRREGAGKLLSLAEKEKDVTAQAMALRILSDFYMNKLDREKALLYIQRAIKDIPEEESLEVKLLNYNQLGRIHYHFQEYQNAVEAYEKGLKLYDGSNIYVVSTLYLNLGNAYKYLNNKEKSLEVYKLGLEFSEKFGMPEDISFANYILGYTLMDNAQYAQAEKYFLTALKDSARIQIKSYVFNAHHAIAINYSRWGKYEEAEKHNFVALKYFRDTGNKLYEYDVLNNLSTLYYKKGDMGKSAFYGEQALVLALALRHERAIAGTATTLLKIYAEKRDENNLRRIIPIIDKYKKSFDHRDFVSKVSYSEGMALLAEKKGNYSESLSFLKNAISYRDSLYNEKLANKADEMVARYEMQKRENQILKLNSEKEVREIKISNQRRNIYSLVISLLIITMLLSIAFYYYLKARKQRDYILGLQKEIHHRIKNNLAVIDSFIEFIKTASQFGIHEINELQSRIHSMYEVHQQLFAGNSFEGYADFERYCFNLMENLKKLYGSSKLTYRAGISHAIKIHHSQLFPLGLILNEFVTNSIKHSESGVSTITVNMSLLKNSLLFELFEDASLGTKKFEPGENKGYGMRLINLLSDQLEGKKSWEVIGEALKFTLIIPVI